MVLIARVRVTVAGLGLAVAVLGASVPAMAQPTDAADIARRREAAEKIAYDGVDLLERGQFADAAAKFREAENLIHSPAFQVYEARAQQGRGRLIEARDLLQKVVDEQLPEYAPEVFWKAKSDAKELLSALEPRIPKIVVELAGEGVDQVDVTVDGKPNEQAARGETVFVNPGKHKVVARALDGREALRTVTVAEGATERVVLDLGSPVDVPTGGPEIETPDEEGGRSYVVPGILFGVGAASLLVGAITGGVFVGQANDLKDKCPNDQCDPSLEEEGDSVSTLGNVSTATLVIGAAAIVAGAIVLLIPLEEDEPAEGAPDEELEARAPQLRIGLGSLGLQGSF